MKFMPVIVSLGFLFSSCGVAKEKPLQENAEKDSVQALAKNPSQAGWLMIIKAYEDSMHQSLELDPRLGKVAIKAYTDYQQAYWKDTLAADFLFKAAEIADNLNDPKKAIALFQQCHDQYLVFPFRAECLFRIGNIYDYKLNDYTSAKEYYKDVIKFFPKSPMVKNAEAAIQNLGKSDTDLIREFEKKNGVKR